MRRYKLYLVGGPILEITAKSVRVESQPEGYNLVVRGEKNQVLFSVCFPHVKAYGAADAIISEEGA
jgi:hypothetical protein